MRFMEMSGSAQIDPFYCRYFAESDFLAFSKDLTSNHLMLLWFLVKPLPGKIVLEPIIAFVKYRCR